MGLTWLWVWTLEGVSQRWVRFVFALTFCVGLGIGLEWYQTQIPGRFGTSADIMLNTVGVVVGLLLAHATLSSKPLESGK